MQGVIVLDSLPRLGNLGLLAAMHHEDDGDEPGVSTYSLMTALGVQGVGCGVNIRESILAETADMVWEAYIGGSVTKLVFYQPEPDC